MHRCIYICACIYVEYTHINTGTLIYAYVHNAHILISVHIDIYIHMCKPIYTNRHIYFYIYSKNTHVSVYIYTHTCVFLLLTRTIQQSNYPVPTLPNFHFSASLPMSRWDSGGRCPHSSHDRHDQRALHTWGPTWGLTCVCVHTDRAVWPPGRAPPPLRRHHAHRIPLQCHVPTHINILTHMHTSVFVVVLHHINSILILPRRWYDVWYEKENAQAYTFTIPGMVA